MLFKWVFSPHVYDLSVVYPIPIDNEYNFTRSIEIRFRQSSGLEYRQVYLWGLHDIFLS